MLEGGKKCASLKLQATVISIGDRSSCIINKNTSKKKEKKKEKKKNSSFFLSLCLSLQERVHIKKIVCSVVSNGNK